MGPIQSALTQLREAQTSDSSPKLGESASGLFSPPAQMAKQLQTSLAKEERDHNLISS